MGSVDPIKDAEKPTINIDASDDHKCTDQFFQGGGRLSHLCSKIISTVPDKNCSSRANRTDEIIIIIIIKIIRQFIRRRNMSMKSLHTQGAVHPVHAMNAEQLAVNELTLFFRS